MNIVSAGTCTIRASQSGNATYNAAPNVSRNITISPVAQTITVTTPAPATIEAGQSFVVAASASSGLDVTIGASGACSIASGGLNTATINANTKGTCTVTFSQAGNGNYLAAASVVNAVDVTLLTQTITITTAAPTTIAVGTPFDVAATASSGLGVAITVGGGCSRTAGGTNTATINLTSALNPCTVYYNQAGGSGYEPAIQRTNIVEAYRENQAITVSTPAPAKAANGVSFNVVATASSGLNVDITTGSGCTGAGTNSTSITMQTGTSSCTVFYNQGGNENFRPAAQVVNVVADGTAPVIAEVTPVAAVTNSTPRYTFSSTEAGRINFAGACSSSTTAAGTGDNLIVLTGLEEGVYDDCSLQVIDAANNVSNTLTLGTFEVVPGMKAYVKPVAAGAADCSSWADACADIQQAIDVAAADEVWLAMGVYRPAAALQLKGGVKIYGGFTGNETSRAKASPSKNLTIISGDIDADDVIDSRGLVMNQSDVSGSNLGRLFAAVDLTAQEEQQVVLSGLLLNAASGSLNGAAVLVDNSSVLLEKSQVIAVKGAVGGAVAVTNGGRFEADTVTFLRNQSTGAGGAIASTGSAANHVMVHNSLLDANIAGTHGGAIHHVAGKMTVLNSTFHGNRLAASTGKGGAINLGALVHPDAAAIKYVTMVNNRAGTLELAGGRGGAISIDSGAGVTGVVTLANSLVLDNQAATGANIADMDKISDAGYNIVGFNGVSGMVYGAGNTTYEFVGTSSTAPTVLLSDLLETSLAANGGATANLRLKEGSYARDRIPNIHPDCAVTNAIKRDQRGYVRPDQLGSYCDVGALEYDVSMDQCKDSNREAGFFAGFYPQTNTLCYGGSSLSLSGSIHPFFLVMLALLGVASGFRRRCHE